MSRLVITADTHLPSHRAGQLPGELLAACEGAAAILHAGDVTSPEVLEILAGYAPVHAVLGNCDPWSLAHLPERLTIDVTPALRIGMVHDAGPAAGRSARAAAAFPGCAIVVYGHTHMPEVASEDGLVLLNPGSPTQRRRAPRHSFAVLDVEHEPALPVLHRL